MYGYIEWSGIFGETFLNSVLITSHFPDLGNQSCQQLPYWGAIFINTPSPVISSSASPRFVCFARHFRVFRHVGHYHMVQFSIYDWSVNILDLPFPPCFLHLIGYRTLIYAWSGSTVVVCFRDTESSFVTGCQELIYTRQSLGTVGSLRRSFLTSDWLSIIY